MRAGTVTVWLSILIATLAFNTTRGEVVAHWTFEDNISGVAWPVTGHAYDLFVSVESNDDGSPNHNLDYYTKPSQTITVISDVPPASMFNTGYTPGTQSWDTSATPSASDVMFVDGSNGDSKWTVINFTIEAFFKTGLTSHNQKIAEYPNRWALWIETTGNVKFWGSGSTTITLPVNYNDGELRYIAASYDSTANELKIRGLAEHKLVSIITGPRNGSLAAPNNNFAVGGTYASDKFGGKLDCIRYSSRVLYIPELLAVDTPKGTVTIIN